MKKTLAAVLAAMMALSTATVALAKDTDTTGDVTEISKVESLTPGDTRNPVDFGAKEKFIVTIDKDGTPWYETDLGEALADKKVKVDVTVTDGRSLLKKAPTVKAYKVDGEIKAVLEFEMKHTYGLEYNDKDSSKDTRSKIDMRIRVTALENGVLDLNKGDTYSIDKVLFNAGYYELADFGKDMTITAQEVKDNNVIADASLLLKALDEKETETATFYFGDTAAFTAKISEAQKNQNLYYETKVADEYYEEYEELSFEAIQFKGSPKFLRKGTLTFNAIGDEDTAVYEVTADGLVELEIAEYDSTYDVVTVEGISALTSYLVASEALEVEAEVEAEPEVEEENPNTGAC